MNHLVRLYDVVLFILNLEVISWYFDLSSNLIHAGFVFYIDYSIVVIYLFWFQKPFLGALIFLPISYILVLFFRYTIISLFVVFILISEVFSWCFDISSNLIHVGFIFYIYYSIVVLFIYFDFRSLLLVRWSLFQSHPRWFRFYIDYPIIVFLIYFDFGSLFLVLWSLFQSHPRWFHFYIDYPIVVLKLILISEVVSWCFDFSSNLIHAGFVLIQTILLLYYLFILISEVVSWCFDLSSNLIHVVFIFI